MFTLTSDSIGHLPQLVTCSSNCSTLKYTFYTMHTSFVVKTSQFGSGIVVFVGIFHEEKNTQQTKKVDDLGQPFIHYKQTVLHIYDCLSCLSPP